MTDKVSMLKAIYRAFNLRDIPTVLSTFDPEVDWPNGMEGGIEHGHKAVREYWTRQWTTFDPNVEPIEIIRISDSVFDVSVKQVVRNMEGDILVEQVVHHVYTFKGDLIKQMEIVNN